MTLPRQNRITSKEIKDIFKNGKRFKNSLLSLIFIKNNKKSSCLAVVVPSKVVKKSVNRNKIRRKTKEIFKTLLPLFKESYNIIILFHKNPLISQKELYNKIEEKFKFSKII